METDTVGMGISYIELMDKRLKTHRITGQVMWFRHGAPYSSKSADQSCMYSSGMSVCGENECTVLKGECLATI